MKAMKVLDWCGWLTPLPDRLNPDNDPGLHATEAEWAPEPVCTGAEYFAPTGIRSPDLPDRLLYPSPRKVG
jgi:hypothetical protein